MHRVQTTKHNQLVSIIGTSWDKKNTDSTRGMYRENTDQTKFTHTLYIISTSLCALCDYPPLSCGESKGRKTGIAHLWTTLFHLNVFLLRPWMVIIETVWTKTKLQWDWHDPGCGGGLRFQNILLWLSISGLLLQLSLPTDVNVTLVKCPVVTMLLCSGNH